MAPELEEKSNSRYIMLCAGILCILGDFKYDKKDRKNSNLKMKNESSNEKNITNENNVSNELNNVSDLESNKKPNNPYDYPEDF